MSANGADAVVRTLADLGVDVCFANPGTSEMHLVAALDRESRIRPVLCLFEGVATGAADGFARMAGRPAMTLLHLGAGYANGGANLHNARRAFSAVVNIVGDHARDHRHYDAPLTSDIAAQAATSSIWVDTVSDPQSCAAQSHAALEASIAGASGPATLIVPADCAWETAEQNAFPLSGSDPLATTAVTEAARLFRAAAKPAVILGSHATRDHEALEAAGRLAAAGATVFTDTFVARQLRGAGVFAPRRLRYFAEEAMADLAGHDLLLLVATDPPVSFFAYPGQRGWLAPADATIVTLVSRGRGSAAALSALAEAVDAPAAVLQLLDEPHPCPDGPPSAASVGASVARHMPAGTIISDDGVTSSGPVFTATAAAAAHDWLCLTGGAIGQGLPVAIGAAVAQPEASVVVLTGDGAAMYTVQSLWTMAREALNVTVIVFANSAYRILDVEFARTGAGMPGAATRSLLRIDQPALDWCALAQGMGVKAQRCDDASSFDLALAESLSTAGPTLLEVVIE